MKPIETRVTEGLQAFAEGITMDVLDTERVHRDLFERISEDRARRHRTLSIAAVAALVVGLLSVTGVQLLAHRSTDSAIPPSALSLSRADVAGIWASRTPDDPNTMLWLDTEGRFAVDSAGHVDTRPSGSGKYQLGRDSIRFLDRKDERCGDTTWRADLITPGRMDLTLTAATSSCDLPIGIGGEMIRVVPASAESLELTARLAQADTPLAGDLLDTQGFWLRAGTDEAFRFIIWGGYAMLSPAPQGVVTTDQGGALMPADGQLTLTSGEKSRDCAAGDLLLLENVRFSQDWMVMRADVARDDCGRFTTGTLTWIRLAPN